MFPLFHKTNALAQGRLCLSANNLLCVSLCDIMKNVGAASKQKYMKMEYLFTRKSKDKNFKVQESSMGNEIYISSFFIIFLLDNMNFASFTEYKNFLILANWRPF